LTTTRDNEKRLPWSSVNRMGRGKATTAKRHGNVLIILYS
jgi:hypothetical protein